MALENGWFKVYRPMLRSNIWRNSNPNHCKVLMTLMSMANFDEKVTEFNGNPIVLEAGQIITSLQEITDKCGKGIGMNHVRSALTRFKKLGFLTIKSTKRGSLITISKYETYTDAILKKHKQKHKQNTNQVQAEHKSDTTNKNFKKKRIEEEEKVTPPEIQIELSLKDFYYNEQSNKLSDLIQETAYKGDQAKIPLIMKKFSCFYFSKNDSASSFEKINAAFKLWLMNEREFTKPQFNDTSREGKKINISKLLNK